MSRKNPTFNKQDIVRICCNNLAPFELLETRIAFLGNPCNTTNEGLCQVLKALLSTSKIAGSISDSGAAGLLRRIPKIGQSVYQALSFIAELHPYVELALTILCEDKGGDVLGYTDSTIQKIENLRGKKDELRAADKKAEIANSITQIGYRGEEMIAEIIENALPYGIDTTELIILLK